MIRIVCQNPCFSNTWCTVSSIFVAPENTSFTSWASASVSLHGLVKITASHIFGLDSQFGPFSQISSWILLCTHVTPLQIGRGINLCNSTGHKLIVAPLTSDPMQDYCTVCPFIHGPRYISFQNAPTRLAGM